MNSTRSFRAVCGLSVSVFVVSHAAAQCLTVRSVMIAGTEVPGLPDVLTFVDSPDGLHRHAISDDGSAYAGGFLDEDWLDNFAFVAVDSDGRQTVAALDGNPFPGFDSDPDYVFESLIASTARMGRDGSLLIDTDVIGRSAVVRFRADGSSEIIAMTGEQVPTLAPGFVYDDIDLLTRVPSDRPMVLDVDVAFAGSGSGLRGAPDFGGVVMAETDDGLVVVARDQRDADWISPGLDLRTVSGRGVTDDGVVLVLGSVQGAGVTFENDLVWFLTSGDDDPSFVLREGDAFPFVGDGVRAVGVGAELGRGGDLFIGATLEGDGITRFENDGILLHRDAVGSVTRVLQKGDPAFGLPMGVTYRSVRRGPVVNASGQAAMQIRLDDPNPVGREPIYNAIYRWDPVRGMTLIAFDLGPSPRVVGGENLPYNRLSPLELFINDEGRVAFDVTYAGSQQRRMIVVTSPEGVAELAIREGQRVTVEGAVPVDFVNEIPGRVYLRGLNNRGDMLFRTGFSGHRTAYLVAEGGSWRRCVADTDGNGFITPDDFQSWVVAFNVQSTACDQNGDGLCTPADLSAWVVNFNAGC
ncbi:MAG: hypothetical protein AAF937_09045 [Planctomycetota bacterium]